jgi:hypothetical protein
MEPESSLPYSQVPATCPYPQADQSNSCLPSHFLKIHFNNILPPMVRPSKWCVCSSYLPTKTLNTHLLSPLRATDLAHLILLYFIILIVCVEEYRSQSSSKCNFFHSPITSSLLGLNILLSILCLSTFIICFSLSVRDQFHTVASQISQTENMTTNHGISRVVVVTGDRFVGLSTLITKVTLSRSSCLLALIYSSCDPHLPKTTISSARHS